MTTFKNPIVFINYRRDDSKPEARSLSNDLENAFGKGFVFRDQDDLRAGELWSDKLIDAGNDAKSILAVIGPDWLQVNDKGESRLKNADDWVRKELELAIKAKKIIIPVLVKGAKAPDKNEIPESLHPLFNHQFFDLRDDKWNIDVKALIQDISAVTGIKTLTVQAREKEEQEKDVKEKTSKKKILFMTIGIIALASLLIGFIYFNSGNGTTTTDPTDETSEKPTAKDFCPEFETNAAIKTLLYPFGEINTTDTQYELKIQDQISDICTKLNIFNDVQQPYIEDNRHYNENQAKNKCNSCNSDIFITGLSVNTPSGKANIKAKIGFCDSKYTGYALDEDKLEIVASFSEADFLSVNPNISESLEYAIEIFIGIHQIKSGNLEEGVKIIQKAIENYPKDENIETIARDVLWQAQYKLGDKIASANTLDAMYALNNDNTLPLKLKADIYFQEKQYHEAIENLNIVIDKESNTATKGKFIEKRGDSYFESRQYDKAKIDYETIRVNSKIKATNKIIKANDRNINNFGAVSSLSASDKAQLINLHVQNGNMTEASKILNSIDPNALKTQRQMKAIGLQYSTIKVLKESNLELSPAIRNNFTTTERTRLNNIRIENN